MLKEQHDFSRLLEQTIDPFHQFRTVMDQTQFAQAALLARERFSISAKIESCIGRDTLNLARSLEDQFSGVKLRIDAFEALHRPAIDSILESVLRRQEELAKFTATIEQSFQSMAAPVQRIQSALATLEASARLYSAPAAHWANALSVIASYEQFAMRQAKRLDTDSIVVAERRARVTELAGVLLESSFDAAEAMGSESDFTTVDIRPVKPRIFGPLNSHLGYVYRATVEVDVDLAVADAIPVRICQLGGAIVSTVVRINEAFRRRGGDDIFFPTNRSLWAASIIPAVVAGTERDFANVVDALFFLLYEGSGTAGRLSPHLGEKDLKPLWCLKHLRLYYRHDIEHGGGKDIAKKYQKVGAAFIAIAGKRLPARPTEWTSAQAELYQQLFDMLIKVEQVVHDDGHSENEQQK